MHERTSRAIARLLFVVCCAAPTIVTLCVILASRTPWYHGRVIAAIETSLTRQIGLHVAIDDYQRRTPDEFDLVGVRISHPETRRDIARIRSLTWADDGDRVAVRVRQPEFHADQLSAAWTLLHDRFLCLPEATSRPLEMRADDLTILSDDGPLTLRDVDAWVRPSADQIEATIACLPAAAGGSTPTQISVVRDRGGRYATTRWNLHTGPMPLPCSALSPHFTWLKRLGVDATFSGSLSCEILPTGTFLDLSGSRWEGIDLSGFSDLMHRRLSGTASLRLDRCRLDPDARNNIVGTWIVRNGSVQGDLVASLREHLGWETARRWETDRDASFDLLAVRFAVWNDQLELTGVCNHENPLIADDIAAISGNQATVRIPPDSPLPAIRLAHLLSHPDSELVPMTRQTRSLLSLLSPPAGMPPAAIAGDANVPVPRVTSAGAHQGGQSVIQPR